MSYWGEGNWHAHGLPNREELVEINRRLALMAEWAAREESAVNPIRVYEHPKEQSAP